MLTFNITPDYESPDDTDNVYNIVAVASDDAPGAGGTMAYKKVVVTVTDVDEPGIVTLSSLQPQVDTELTVSVTDPEATDTQIEAATWKWEKSRSRTSGWTAIDGAVELTLTPDATIGYLRATATYNDSFGNGKTEQAVSANTVRAVPSSAVTYTFPLGSDMRSVDENSPAGTNVGAPVAINSDSDVLTYSLSGPDADDFEIDRATGQIKVGPRTILDADEEATYNVTVSAAEAGDDPAVTQVVEITVTNLNEAPMVTEGVTMIKNHMEYDASPMDDGALADEDPSKVVDTYMASDTETTDADIDWTLQGADASKFDISTAGVLTFKDAPNYEMPADAGRNNMYNVTVVATDDGVVNGRNKMTATRAVTIMVTNVKEAGTVTLSTQQPKIGVPLTASVTDLDGAVTDVTWKWERDPSLDVSDDEEVIGGATSATYTPTSDDIVGGTGRYLRAIATYTDPQGKDTSSESSAAIVIVRTDNAPKFGDTENGKRMVAENAATVSNVFLGADDSDPNVDEIDDPVRATDTDGGLLTYRLSGRDAGSFTIMSDTAGALGGQIETKAKLDYETKSTYMVTVTATDPGGLSGSIDVTINVTDVNEAPEILVGGLSISGSAPAPYAENGTGPVATYRAVGSNAASATWSLSGADAGDLRISRSGVLSFPRSPNYEAPTDEDTDNVYQVTVNATDRRYNAMLAVTVRVTDVYEPPFVPSAPNVLQTVGEPTSLDVSWRAPSNGGGPDITSYDLQYRMSGSGNFIDGPQNVTGTSTTITGLTEDTSYEVQVRATNDEGDSGWSTAGMGSTGTSSNNAPIFPDPTLTRSIMENTEADTNVGAVILAATDADRGDTLTYTMEGTDAASFTFDASTRQIKTSADLDFETKSSYSVTIKVSDGTDSDTVVVTVTVTDVNEAPTISGLSNTDYAENGTDPVATFTAMDPEGTTISWTLEGTDSDALSISSDGVLTFRSPLPTTRPRPPT